MKLMDHGSPAGVARLTLWKAAPVAAAMRHHYYVMDHELIVVGIGTGGALLGAALGFFGSVLAARSQAQAVIDAAAAQAHAQYAATLEQLNHKERLAAYSTLAEASQALIADLVQFARLDTTPGPEGPDLFGNRGAAVRAAAASILFHGPHYVHEQARAVELHGEAVIRGIKNDFPVYSGWRALVVASKVRESPATAERARRALQALSRVKHFVELADDLADDAELPPSQLRLRGEARADARQALTAAQSAEIIDRSQAEELLEDAGTVASPPDHQCRDKAIEPFKETLEEFVSAARHELDDTRPPRA
ncbi:hypothetical protein ACGFYV_37335 [Streptomyces sp. NPDC048297]|uniref:hypothetical protein n=1 Tax=Streptomyces sp. NPDC048297 TaxID=3365531 RepID=UPI0037159495